MSNRDDNRKNPLGRLFGGAPPAAYEPCVRCHKPETSRVILVAGDAAWHKTVLCWSMDNALAAAMVTERWADEVWPMHQDCHQIASDVGHPELVPLPDTPEGIAQLRAPLSWRMCRGCAAKANLPTINAERLTAIILSEDYENAMPRVIMAPEGSS